MEALMSRRTAVPFVVLGLVLAACGRQAPVAGTKPAPPRTATRAAPASARALASAPNVYAASMTGRIAPRLAGLRPLVYVPNSQGQSVDVIDPVTMRVVDTFAVGAVPHHVFPAWDMHALYVGNTASNTLTEIDIHTHRPVRTIPVTDPYNLYWPWAGGSVKAMVVAERFNRIDFRDPVSWKLIKSVPIPWSGIDHGDFTADGRYWLGSTEYAGVVVKIDVVKMALVGHVNVGGLPVDARLSPDGKVMFVANQGLNGVSVIDPNTLQILAFISTGRGAHGFQISRDTRKLYVANRLAGTISVIDLATRRVVATWRVGGSPDMMQLNWAGTQIWVSNRYDASVSVVDTRTGSLIKVIACGPEAHGLTFFPSPGDFSTGHNGVYR
jgi:YVTN family beta-propeller protein